MFGKMSKLSEYVYINGQLLLFLVGRFLRLRKVDFVNEYRTVTNPANAPVRSRRALVIDDC